MSRPGAAVGQGGAMASSSPSAPWFGWLLVVAGCVVGLGSALPWITLDGPGAAAATLFIQSKGGGLGGLDHEGAVTVVVGAFAMGLGVAHLLGRAPRLAVWGGLASGLATMALVGLAAADGSSLADPFGGAAAGVVQGRGIGLWVTAAGAVLLVVGSLAARLVGSEAQTGHS